MSERYPGYRTALGCMRCGDSLDLMGTLGDGSVDLCVTSPPFALLRTKEYGNATAEGYVAWLSSFAEKLAPKLAPTGSLVLDLGGSYVRGSPERSLWPYRVLIDLCDRLGYVLAQDVFWQNRARLPSPVEWVNKRKVRLKDSVDTVWWLSRSAWPKADTSKVLVPYSARMGKLLATGEAAHTAGLRPSGHDVRATFQKDNGGALPSSLLDFPNTESNGSYLARCRRLGIKAHPARFPPRLPEFFVRMLTDPGDFVLDMFAGSNTTGAVAEAGGRRWESFELRPDYVAASAFRFMGRGIPDTEALRLHGEILEGTDPWIGCGMPQPSAPDVSGPPSEAARSWTARRRVAPSGRT